VAEKMGFPRDILDRARQYRQKTEGATATMIQRLEQLQAEVSREKDHLHKLQQETVQRRDRLSASLEKIREKRDQILLRVEERGMKLLSQAESEVGRLVQDLSQLEPGKKKPQRELREIEKRLHSRMRRRKRKQSKIENLRPGEWVRILDLDREGTVSEVQGTIDTAEVLVGAFKIKTSLDNLERVVGKEDISGNPPGPILTVSSSGEALREINVVGLTVDDALPVVEKFIDTALLENLDTVTIIHGGGSGRLKNAIRDYLKDHKAVTRFGHGDPLRGGFGVTVVHLGWNRNVAVNLNQGDRPPCG
jgi:DNA mismatch repair protein MutS2